MAKKTNEYFLLIEQQAAICVEAAALLLSVTLLSLIPV